MLWGALVTLEVAVLSMVLGVFFAVLLALACRLALSRSYGRSPRAGWRLARNTPALFQIYMAYFGLGVLGIHLDSYPALLAGITFNNAGYLAETFRGGLRAVPDDADARRPLARHGADAGVPADRAAAVVPRRLPSRSPTRWSGRS